VFSVEIMGYDAYGATFSKVAGPNAPLDDSCAPAGQQTGSATSAFKLWTGAGFSPNQIVLGVASYGHGFHVPNANIGNDSQKLAQFPAVAADPTVFGTGEAPGDFGKNFFHSVTSLVLYCSENTKDICGNATGPGGVFDYSDMVNRGFIDSKGKATGSLLSQYDECSQTVIKDDILLW
jgi:chitinase